MWLKLIFLLVLLCSFYFSWKLFAAPLLLFFLFYRFVTKNFDYWERLGVPYKAGKFPWGSIDFVKVQKNNALHQLDMCNEFKDEKFFGYFLFGKPTLMVNDVELVKKIKVSDFHHFVDSQDENLAKRLRQGGDLDSLLNHNITTSEAQKCEILQRYCDPDTETKVRDGST